MYRATPTHMFAYKGTAAHNALFVDVLYRGKSIDNNYYLKKCLKPLVKSIKSERPTSGTKNIYLLHDNARPHVHINVKNYINS